MRPPAVEKLGYYPTDEPIIDILDTYITPATEKARLFDPCAGEGIAAAKLGRALNCATWGVELSPARATKASQVLDRVFQAPWQACFLSNESISLLLLRTYPKIKLKRMSAAASLRKAIQLSGFLHQRILILRRLANHPNVLSITQRRAGKVFSPGIGHSSTLGSFLLRRCLI